MPKGFLRTEKIITDQRMAAIAFACEAQDDHDGQGWSPDTPEHERIAWLESLPRGTTICIHYIWGDKFAVYTYLTKHHDPASEQDRWFTLAAV